MGGKLEWVKKKQKKNGRGGKIGRGGIESGKIGKGQNLQDPG